MGFLQSSSASRAHSLRPEPATRVGRVCLRRTIPVATYIARWEVCQSRSRIILPLRVDSNAVIKRAARPYRDTRADTLKFSYGRPEGESSCVGVCSRREGGSL